MTKRSSILIAAFGLLASLSFATPSHAGAQFKITAETLVSDTVSPAGHGGATGTWHAAFASPLPSATYTAPTNNVLFGSYTATAHTTQPFPTQYVQFVGALTYAVTIKDVASSLSHTVDVTANFNGVLYRGSSLFSPTTVTMTPAVVTIGSNAYTLTGFNTTITGSTGKIYLDITTAAVPEPTSMALLGIGMAGFLSFRRFFTKRKGSL